MHDRHAEDVPEHGKVVVRRILGAMIVAVAVVSCTSTPTVALTSSPATSPTGTPTEVTASPTAAAPATAPGQSAATAAPLTDEPTSLTGVTASALGPLSGNWIFFAQRVPTSSPSGARLEVWGITPAGGQRLAFSYPIPIGGVPEAPLDNSPYLRRQFSPDGHQVVVSTLAGLVIVDLPSGQARRVGAGGQFPSWSKDGKTIAYIATVSQPDPQRVPPERAIWVVPVAGGTPRELIDVGYSSTAPEWSSDSSLLMAQLKDGVGLVDVATGHEVPGGRIPFALTTTGAHWPAGRAQVIVTLIRRDDTQIVVYDHATRITGFLAQFPRPFDPSPCQCPMGLVPRDPRWNPAGTGEVLYVLLDEKANRTEADILDTQSGHMSKMLLDVTQATWSSDGKQIVYISRGQQGSDGAIRVYDRTTGSDRELIAVFSGATRPSVVSVAY